MAWDIRRDPNDPRGRVVCRGVYLFVSRTSDPHFGPARFNIGVSRATKRKSRSVNRNLSRFLSGSVYGCSFWWLLGWRHRHSGITIPLREAILTVDKLALYESDRGRGSRRGSEPKPGRELSNARFSDSIGRRGRDCLHATGHGYRSDDLEGSTNSTSRRTYQDDDSR